MSDSINLCSCILLAAAPGHLLAFIGHLDGEETRRGGAEDIADAAAAFKEERADGRDQQREASDVGLRDAEVSPASNDDAIHRRVDTVEAFRAEFRLLREGAAAADPLDSGGRDRGDDGNKHGHCGGECGDGGQRLEGSAERREGGGGQLRGIIGFGFR